MSVRLALALLGGTLLAVSASQNRDPVPLHLLGWSFPVAPVLLVGAGAVAGALRVASSAYGRVARATLRARERAALGRRLEQELAAARAERDRLRARLTALEGELRGAREAAPFGEQAGGGRPPAP